jgi:hypothetical protein
LEKFSFWTAKANFFSLSVAVARKIEAGHVLNVEATRTGLLSFAANPPNEYLLAAREGVNNKRERQTRNSHIAALLV